ncbi:hypothetical protein MY3296_003760 [Beauveria thailandica]
MAALVILARANQQRMKPPSWTKKRPLVPSSVALSYPIPGRLTHSLLGVFPDTINSQEHCC